jgi:4a-hydroxytetrahydrobiopterin dehydratase
VRLWSVLVIAVRRKGDGFLHARGAIGQGGYSSPPHASRRNPYFPFEMPFSDDTSRQPKPTRTMADLLNAQDIKAWLKKLPQWDHEKKHIERVFEFDDFSQAIEFVNGVAEIAEEDDHHPDIDIRYSKVTLRLSTHSEGGLTDMDFEVAEKIDTLVDE